MNTLVCALVCASFALCTAADIKSGEHKAAENAAQGVVVADDVPVTPQQEKEKQKTSPRGYTWQPQKHDGRIIWVPVPRN